MHMRVVAISDTHSFHGGLELPDGDVLVHAGDHSGRGTRRETEDFVAWLGDQPHRDKVFIAGNHDRFCEDEPTTVRRMAEKAGVVYLQDDLIELYGRRIYGSPWTPEFMNWSFMKDREDLYGVWEKIPHNLDLLITHGPPYGHGDLALGGRVVGCLQLLTEVLVKNPRFHVFGHIHGGHGVTESSALGEGVCSTKFINAAICTEGYNPTQQPMVISGV